MNEEKSKTECGEAEQISGDKKSVVRNCTREAVESTDKVKEENETGASMENARRYLTD